MSFFGNNPRPDVRPGSEGQERTTRSETRFSTDTLPPAAEPPMPNAYMANDSRSSTLTGSPGPTPPDRCTNIIAAGAKWKGTLTVEDSVRIDGLFSGEIQSKATVHVAEGAQVDAKIKAAFVVIAGTFQGEVRCEQRVDLLPHSKVSGDINTKVFIVHEGATLDATISMTGESARPSNGSRNSRNGATPDDEQNERRSRENSNNGVEAKA
ncbi:MAG TPA: polymer-forming cytoskeletal protein [Dehalococcoidia bacterium]|nr:polymer-forming cytoskeletal protein [Dehalococcoidia bacterium]